MQIDTGRLAAEITKALRDAELELDALTIRHDAKGVTVTIKASASDQLSLLNRDAIA